MITAPFNFVPYNKKVYFPSWAKEEPISQDIPFSDEKSGIIHVVITAKTPVFIRNGHEKDTEENEFSYYLDKNGEKRYFIPGTSIKGMIRSVFEANSFCKITQINDSNFPCRDVSDSEYRNKLKDARCGYLEQTSQGEYILSDRGTPGRISIKDISNDLYHCFCANNLPTKDSVASAKYNFIEQRRIGLPQLFVADEERNKNKPAGVDNRDFYRPAKSENNAQQGNIVFTGQNSKRVERKIAEITLYRHENKYKIKGQDDIKIELPPISVEVRKAIDDFINGEEVYLDKKYRKIKDVRYKYERRTEIREWRFIERDGKTVLQEIKAASGKAYEFVFFEQEKQRYELTRSDTCIADFFSMYQYSPDFQDYWLKKLDNKEKIPVFFTLGSNQKVENIGLSYLFKYPYANSVSDAVKGDHKDSRLDLAEIVFGSKEIKGRVSFSSAKLVKNVNSSINPVTTILASPRASYYPVYLQEGTWKNPSEIKGRKRYLIYKQPINTQTNDNAEVETTFIPLPSGSQFAGKIFFHNLNSIELGALLSALTFHGNEQLFHSIGAAKPYGYGKISLMVEKLELSNGDSLNEVSKSDWLKYLSCFEDDISKEIGEPWRETPQIKNLHSIAKGIPDDLIDKFRYMKMNIDKSDENEFVDSKKNGERLQYYCDIIGDANIFVPQDIDTLVWGAETKEKEKADAEERERLKEAEVTNKNKAVVLGAKYELGDAIQIKVISDKPKKGIAADSDVEVSIVTRQVLTVGDTITVKVKQKAKDNRIIQVEYE
jgi:CRISPR-associated protein (TIGR03986 family)